MKRSGVNALHNAFEADLIPIAQTTSGGGLGHFPDKTGVNASGLWNHILWKPHIHNCIPPNNAKK